MTGKEKCNLLKEIRRELAESNGIVYLTSECTQEGDCKGTCPKCDAEVRYLDAELNRKAARGEAISVSGLSLETYNAFQGNSRFSSLSGCEAGAEEFDVMGEYIPEEIDGELQILPEEDKIIEMGHLQANDTENYEKYFQFTIEEMDFTIRTCTLLKGLGINTLEELVDMTEKDFIRAQRFGRKSIEEIKEKLAMIGLKLKIERE